MKIDWGYPLIWGIDTKSHYKSLWLGWWLVTWRLDQVDGSVVEFDISFQPGL